VEQAAAIPFAAGLHNWRNSLVGYPQRAASVPAQHIPGSNIGRSSLEVAAFSSQRAGFGQQLNSSAAPFVATKKIGVPRVKTGEIVR